MPNMLQMAMGQSDPVALFLQAFNQSRRQKMAEKDREEEQKRQALRDMYEKMDREYQQKRRSEDEADRARGREVGEAKTMAEIAGAINKSAKPAEVGGSTLYEADPTLMSIWQKLYPGQPGPDISTGARQYEDQRQREEMQKRKDEAEIEKKLRPPRGQNLIKETDASGRVWLIDPETGQGQQVPGITAHVPSDPTPRYTVQQGVGPDGKPVWMKVNNMTGEMAPVEVPQGVMPPPKGPQQASPGLQKKVEAAQKALAKEQALVAAGKGSPHYQDANGQFSLRLFAARNPETKTNLDARNAILYGPNPASGQASDMSYRTGRDDQVDPNSSALRQDAKPGKGLISTSKQGGVQIVRTAVHPQTGKRLGLGSDGKWYDLK